MWFGLFWVSTSEIQDKKSSLTSRWWLKFHKVQTRILYFGKNDRNGTSYYIMVSDPTFPKVCLQMLAHHFTFFCLIFFLFFLLILFSQVIISILTIDISQCVFLAPYLPTWSADIISISFFSLPQPMGVEDNAGVDSKPQRFVEHVGCARILL